MNRNLEKNVSIWRGTSNPPTDYHLWLRDDGNIYIKEDQDWISITSADTSSILGELQNKIDLIENNLSNLQNIFAYGVEFNVNVADPHLTRIGNMSFHKSLPIQSRMRGCIAQGGVIQYWLDDNDWKFRKDTTGFILENITITVTNGVGIITHSVFSTLQYEDQYVKINKQVFLIQSINTQQHTATINTSLKTGTYNVELGAVLNGYDGTVRVYCPEFYIKSEVEGDYRRVWISTIKLDDTWTHQQAVLIDAYSSTILNTAISGMGYLSTLSVPSAISVVNKNTYCRGGRGRTENDKYLTPNPCLSDLLKPVTDKNLTVSRNCATNANSHVMTFHEYQYIFYWLYVIEYANFNSQEEYQEQKTSDGYMQGGLGEGVSNIQNWTQLLGNSAVTPCGSGNLLGNKNGTWFKSIYLTTLNNIEYPAQAYLFTRWHGFENIFGDIWQMVDGCLIDKSISNNSQYNVYTCDDPVYFSNTINEHYTITGQISTESGFINSFNIGDSANMLPNNVEGEDTLYMCDYLMSDSTGPLAIMLTGGSADNQSRAGVGTLNITFPTSGHWYGVGFRTVSPVINN